MVKLKSSKLSAANIEWKLADDVEYNKSESDKGDGTIRYLPGSGDMRFITEASITVKVNLLAIIIIINV